MQEYNSDYLPDRGVSTKSLATDFILAEAATEEESGFFALGKPLAMRDICGAVYEMLKTHRISILTADPTRISAPIAAGRVKLNGEMLVVIAFRSTFVTAYQPHEVEARMKEMIEEGLVDPFGIVKTLYKIVEPDVKWELP